MYVFLSIRISSRTNEQISHVNTLTLILLGDFETGILNNSIVKLLEYIAHVNSDLDLFKFIYYLFDLKIFYIIPTYLIYNKSHLLIDNLFKQIFNQV